MAKNIASGREREIETGMPGMTPCSPQSERLPRYVPYPMAMQILVRRMSATPGELAIWIWLGPEAGGLKAYEFWERPGRKRRLRFPDGFDGAGEPCFDYMPTLMGAWFASRDVEQFKPQDRYMSGEALIARWAEVPGLNARAFVRAKIAESRLQDLHPVTGGTEGSGPTNQRLPPVEQGFFSVAEIEVIEREDLGRKGTKPLAPEDKQERSARLKRRHRELAGTVPNPTRTLAEEEGISDSRVRSLLRESRADTASPPRATIKKPAGPFDQLQDLSAQAHLDEKRGSARARKSRA